MTREQKVSTLITISETGKSSYASIPDPIDEETKASSSKPHECSLSGTCIKQNMKKLQDELLQGRSKGKRNRDMQRYSGDRAGISMLRDQEQ